MLAAKVALWVIICVQAASYVAWMVIERRSARARRSVWMVRACRAMPTFLQLPLDLGPPYQRLSIAIPLAEAGEEFQRDVDQVAARGTYRVRPEPDCGCLLCQAYKAMLAEKAAIFGVAKADAAGEEGS